jgi:hypothetical protein
MDGAEAQTGFAELYPGNSSKLSSTFINRTLQALDAFTLMV